MGYTALKLELAPEAISDYLPSGYDVAGNAAVEVSLDGYVSTEATPTGSSESHHRQEPQPVKRGIFASTRQNVPQQSGSKEGVGSEQRTRIDKRTRSRHEQLLQRYGGRRRQSMPWGVARTPKETRASLKTLQSQPAPAPSQNGDNIIAQRTDQRIQAESAQQSRQPDVKGVLPPPEPKKKTVDIAPDPVADLLARAKAEQSNYYNLNIATLEPTIAQTGNGYDAVTRANNQRPELQPTETAWKEMLQPSQPTYRRKSRFPELNAA